MTNQVEYVKDTFEEYLGKKDYISASDIKNFLKSPKYYFNNKYGGEGKDDEKDRRHLAVGSAFHELVLEPHKFQDHYMIVPKCDQRTAKGQAQYAAYENLAKSTGKQLVFDDEAALIMKMADSARVKKPLVELMRDSFREVSCYKQDEKTGLMMRIRPDILPENKSTIGDLKTCLDSGKKEFTKSIYSWSYDISVPYYLDMLGREHYVFIAIEKAAPFQTSMYQLDDEKVDYGRKKYRMALDLIKWSKDNNYWSDYNEFEVLKECYELENLDQFFDIIEKSEGIILI